MPHPCSGIVKCFSLASANRETLYSLYASIRRSLFKPAGLNLSRGMRKKIRSLAVTRTQVLGVIFRMILFFAIQIIVQIFLPCAFLQSEIANPGKFQPFHKSVQLFFHPVLFGNISIVL